MAALGREITGEFSRAALLGLPHGSVFRLCVVGTSMAPALRHGDEVVGRRTNSPGDWALGDILVVELPDVGLVVHRLMWAGNDSVRTRGDGSGLMDRPVALSQVVGMIIEVHRAGRDVSESAFERRLAWGWAFGAAGLSWTLVRLRRLGREPQGQGEDA